MPKNTQLINVNNNKSQISLDENLLGEFEITILLQEGGSSQDALGLGETSTKVNIEVRTKNPEDLLPKLEGLGFNLTKSSDILPHQIKDYGVGFLSSRIGIPDYSLTGFRL